MPRNGAATPGSARIGEQEGTPNVQLPNVRRPSRSTVKALAIPMLLGIAIWISVTVAAYTTGWFPNRTTASALMAVTALLGPVAAFVSWRRREANADETPSTDVQAPEER